MSMRWVRTWLPVAIIAGGIIAAAATDFSDTGLEGGALVISAGLSVWLLNLLYRVGVKGDRERDVEDRARAYFDAHGRWPDDEPAADAPAEDPHEHPHRSKAIDSEHGRRRRR
jgi:hypothetical protein